MAKEQVDSVVIGGGPAGLSAAIYLARARRSVIVLDTNEGRSSGPQINENYLGFPRGVRAARLRQLGRRQAERFGARFVHGAVDAIACLPKNRFEVRLNGDRYEARCLVLATGVTDVWPSIPNVERYIGRSLFWCIVCDGYRTVDKRIMLIGADDEAATTACQFLSFTRDITFVATGIGDEVMIAPERMQVMRDSGITVVQGSIDHVQGARGLVRRVDVAGEWHDVDLLFSLLGNIPNSQLAASLGVLLDERGFIRIDHEQRTNV